LDLKTPFFPGKMAFLDRIISFNRLKTGSLGWKWPFLAGFGCQWDGSGHNSAQDSAGRSLSRLTSAATDQKMRTGILTGFHHPAQGCAARATLGKHHNDFSYPERVESIPHIQPFQGWK
jgi:hypothetical protein